MVEGILLLVIALILGYMSWDKYVTAKERDTLIRGIIAKNATEMRDMQSVDKIKVNANIERTTPDLVDTSAMTESDFDNFIKGQNGAQSKDTSRGIFNK